MRKMFIIEDPLMHWRQVTFFHTILITSHSWTTSSRTVSLLISKNVSQGKNLRISSPGQVLQHLPGSCTGSSHVVSGHSFLMFLHCTLATIRLFFWNCKKIHRYCGWFINHPIRARKRGHVGVEQDKCRKVSVDHSKSCNSWRSPTCLTSTFGRPHMCLHHLESLSN